MVKKLVSTTKSQPKKKTPQKVKASVDKAHQTVTAAVKAKTAKKSGKVEKR